MSGKRKKSEAPPKTNKKGYSAKISLVLATMVFAICAAWLGLLTYLNSDSETRSIKIAPLDRFVSNAIQKATGEVAFSATAGGIVQGPSFWNPAYRIDNFVVFDQSNRAVLEMSDFELDMFSAIRRELSGDDGTFQLSGTNIFLTRDPNGQFNLGNIAQADEDTVVSDTSIGPLIDGVVSEILNEGLNKIVLDNVTVFYSDQKTRTANLFTEGELTLQKRDQGFEISVGLREDLREGADSWVRFNLSREPADDVTDVNFTFQRVDTQLIAQQFEPFEWLEVVDAKMSASFVAQFGSAIEATDIVGVVDLGEGQLKETENNPAADFKAAKAYFDYDADAQRFRFTEIQLDTSLGQLQASGSAQLVFNEDGLDRTIIDIVTDKILFPAGDNFDQDVEISGGLLKGEVSFDPIVLAVNESRLVLGDAHADLTGAITATGENWNSVFTGVVDRLSAKQLVATWPKKAAPKVKAWISENVERGQISDLEVSFKRFDGANDVDLEFEFDGGHVQVLKTAPYLTEAKGRASLREKVFTALVDQGFFDTTKGRVDGSGSEFRILDVTKKPSDGRVDLTATGPLSAGLEILNIEKFKFLDKMGRDTDFATGRVKVDGVIDLKVMKNPPKGSATFDVVAEVTNLESEDLVADQLITSERIKAQATNRKLVISGPVAINGQPANVDWKQDLLDNPLGEYDLKIDVQLTSEILNAFNVAIPDGSFSGSTPASIQVDGKKDEASQFRLVTDFVGAGLRVPILGWRKAAEKEASLKLSGAFGEKITIDEIDFDAPGLNADGAVKFTDEGALDAVEFSNVSAGGWFDAAVTINTTENVTEISGNRLDLRRLNLQRAKGESSGALVINLGALRLTDDLVLRNFRGRLNGGRSTKGTFTANVNGAAPIEGQIYPHEGRTRIDVTSDNAGQILKAANLIESVEDGTIKLTLDTTEQEDVYNVYFQARQFRLLHSNALATLMDNLSLVGLLQKLSGEGIYFDQARGSVLLTPNGAQLTNVSITGASMGMTLDGDFRAENRALAFEGVLTPFYFVNGTPERAIGREFGTKKGSGLISMLYEIEGTADQPKVKAKPLSVLLPGPLKNLFRSKKNRSE